MTGNIAYNLISNTPSPRKATLESTREVFFRQAHAVSQLAERLDDSYTAAVDLLYATPGHVIVCGMGKSGLVGKKIAATLASTGTPAFFMHPGEAYHGDLGMVTPQNTLILISYSGQTKEILDLLPHIEDMGIPVISLVGCLDSTLAKRSKVALDCSVEREVCPNNLAPTSSTLVAMAMGDALAVSLMEMRSFQPRDFARFHPGGSLGRKLLTRVGDLMYKGTLPTAAPTQTVRETLLTMTRGHFGVVLVMEEGQLKGIVTDGDLRRAMQKFDDVLEIPLWRIMTKQPITIPAEMLASEAEELMMRKKVKVLVVTDEFGKVAGVFDIFEQ